VRIAWPAANCSPGPSNARPAARFGSPQRPGSVHGSHRAPQGQGHRGAARVPRRRGGRRPRIRGPGLSGGRSGHRFRGAPFWRDRDWHPHRHRPGIGRILLDGKSPAPCSLAFGRGYPETGAFNQSAIHWDRVCDPRDRGGSAPTARR
jgi:hypothetical protein